MHNALNYPCELETLQMLFVTKHANKFLILLRINNKKVMWIVVLDLSVGCITHSAVSEQVCSSFCSSMGMLESNPGKSCADIY